MGKAHLEAHSKHVQMQATHEFAGVDMQKHKLYLELQDHMY